MKTDYKDFLKKLKELQKEGQLSNLEIYYGDINGPYDTDYNIDKKVILDTISSDGDIVPNITKQNMSYDVDNANYVLIYRYKNANNDNGHTKLDKVFLFVEKNHFQQFLLNLLDTDVDLYIEVYNPGTYKGDITKYKDDIRTGMKIIPSKELIEKNKEKQKIRKR